MSPIIRNFMAVIGGLAIGTLVNAGLIKMGASIIPPPEGINEMVAEDIKSVIHLLETKHYLFPFLAHALGTLVGAFVAAKFSATRHVICALVIGVFFLLGGVSTHFMIGSPTGFMLLDILFAYIPMALLGAKLSGRWSSKILA